METQTFTRQTSSVNGLSRDRLSGDSAFQLTPPTHQQAGAEKPFKLWTLTFDLPGEKVNKFNKKVMDDFATMLEELKSLSKDHKQKDKQIDALMVVSGKPGNFIAGADISLIQAAKSAQEAENLSQRGQELLNQWEDLPFPTVVAIEGAALGGGCEFSLASTAIVMSTDKAARIGLPEVLLGIIPGMGGCIRLPQKLGLAGALDLILTGKTLSGDRAYKSGLAEACLPKENFKQAVENWIQSNLKALQARARIAKEPKLGGMGGAVGKMMEKTPMGRSVILKKARESVIEKSKGQYPAPLEAIEVIRSSGTHFEAGFRSKERSNALAIEAKGFGKMAATDVSKNLIRIFFLTEATKKSNGLPSGQSVTEFSIKNTAVLGAGVMGGGIAQLFADKNLHVRMKDLNVNALALGIQAATKVFKQGLKKRKISQREFLQKLNRIAAVLDYSGFSSVDFVVEAVVEKMEIKKKVLQELENQVRDDCVVATNTSSLSVSEMQTALRNPQRFVGMHFFNPVHRMPLIEVIRGEKTSDQAVSATFQFSKAIGKTPIVVKNAPGFLVNRLLLPYLNEATYLLMDGAPIEEIDEALLDFGMPMGPMELIDEVGIDVAEKVAHILFEAFGDRAKPSPLNETVLKSERLGKKNGKGFYVYESSKDGKGKPKKVLDPKIYDLISIPPRPGSLTPEEIVDRCVLPMINEASRCLDEAVVSSPSDVDLGMIMGTGFPPFRGGLLRYADSLGAARIVERLKKYERKMGARFAPSPVLEKMAQKGERFYSE